jgi:hypothetical protein
MTTRPRILAGWAFPTFDRYAVGEALWGAFLATWIGLLVFRYMPIEGLALISWSWAVVLVALSRPDRERRVYVGTIRIMVASIRSLFAGILFTAVSMTANHQAIGAHGWGVFWNQTFQWADLALAVMFLLWTIRKLARSMGGSIVPRRVRAAYWRDSKWAE